MERQIKISFLERQFSIGDRSRTTIAGYEPAIIKTDRGAVQNGRVIDAERMRQDDHIDYCLFETAVEFADSEINLVSLLSGSEDGRTWLEAFQGYFPETYGKSPATDISLKLLKLTPLEYCLLPGDYFERRKEGRRYNPPGGLIDALPETAVYVQIHPPMKFTDGKWIPNIYYNREAFMADNSKWSYSAKDTLDRSHYHARGIILGKLNAKDIKFKKGEFEGGFPVTHMLSAAYPVSLRQIGRHNPLTINFELVNP